MLSVSGLVSERTPTMIESALVVPTADYSSAAPPIQEILPEMKIEIPPYSVTRIIWE